MKRIGLLFAVTALVAFLTTGAAVAEIKVGIMVPTTGSEATYGKDMENAIKMAVDEINAKGGMLGQKFTTVTADDGCDPQMATAAASKLVASGVDAVVGGYCSGATLPTLKIYADAGVPIVIPAANSTKFIDLNPGNAFLINAIGTYQVDTAVESVQEAGCQENRHRPPGRRLLRGPGQPDPRKDGLKWAMKWWPSRSSTRASRITPLWSPGSSPRPPTWCSGPPTTPTAPWSSSSCARAATRARSPSATAPPIAKLMEIAGKSADGVYAISNPLPEFLTEGKKFIAGLQGQVQGQSRPLLGAQSYDGMNLLADAIKRAGSTDKQGGRRRPQSHQGVQGHCPVRSASPTRTSWPGPISWLLVVKDKKFNLAK